MDMSYQLVFYIESCHEVVTKSTLLAFWKSQQEMIEKHIMNKPGSGVLDVDFIITHLHQREKDQDEI